MESNFIRHLAVEEFSK